MNSARPFQNDLCAVVSRQRPISSTPKLKCSPAVVSVFTSGWFESAEDQTRHSGTAHGGSPTGVVNAQGGPALWVCLVNCEKARQLVNDIFVFAWKSVAIGVGGTAAMDLWMLFMKVGFKIPPIDYARIGRWISHLPSGRFIHADIDKVERMPGEAALGWGVHYAFGVAMAALVIAVCGIGWTDAPTLLPPLIVGTVTIAIPFFIVQPAFGMGVAASKSPHAWFARVRSLMTHVVFGLGLYGVALLIA